MSLLMKVDHFDMLGNDVCQPLQPNCLENEVPEVKV